jgi:hypothetical protein
MKISHSIIGFDTFEQFFGLLILANPVVRLGRLINFLLNPGYL